MQIFVENVKKKAQKDEMIRWLDDEMIAFLNFEP
jgi:hypothetical protein